jgi:WD40 repeat-containing protein SMU1
LTGSQDGTCREFGLRTARMLKEFRGHASSIHTCHYALVDETPLVVTGSGDGTVRIWHGQSAQVLKVLQPTMSTTTALGGATSLVIDPSSCLSDTKVSTSISIHSVLPLHATNQMILVPRSCSAYLVNFQGDVIQTYKVEKESQILVAACLSSPGDEWLYAVTEDGDCLVFDIQSGKLEHTIREFTLDSTSKSKTTTSTMVEITGLIHHPHKAILAAFSNEKTQKRGIVTLWK